MMMMMLVRRSTPRMMVKYSGDAVDYDDDGPGDDVEFGPGLGRDE